VHKEFNVSVAEMDLQDKWTEAVIAARWSIPTRFWFANPCKVWQNGWNPTGRTGM